MLDPMGLMGALVLESGDLWGDRAAPWQLETAEWAFESDSRPNRWDSRPRGASKSSDSAAILLVAMLTTMPVGSRSYVVAVDAAQAQLVLQAAMGWAARTPAIHGQFQFDANKITCKATQSVLEVLPADSASAWGLKPTFVVADEICQWPSTSNAKGVWQAVVSSLGKVKNAKMLVLTTSGSPDHWTRKVYDRAKKSRQWTVADTPGPIPWASKEFLDEQRASLPESLFRRLHLNEWCSPEDRLMLAEDLAACVVERGQLDPVPGQHYAIGVDMGLVRDKTAVAICHTRQMGETRGIVVDHCQTWAGSRLRPVSPEEVGAAILWAAQTYNKATCVCDPWQAASIMEMLKNHRIPVVAHPITGPSGDRLAKRLYLLARDHLLDLSSSDQALIDELASVQLKETSPGTFKMSNAPGTHDDRAFAVALAANELLEHGERRGLRMTFKDVGSKASVARGRPGAVTRPTRQPHPEIA